MTLLSVRSVFLPRILADQAQDHLRACGRQGNEGMALWVGQLQGDVFHIQQTVLPRQQGIRTKDGVCVVVLPEELHRLNVWLYKSRLKLVAQIHSHPGRAYHSDTDDTYAIATTAGALSLFVPNFATNPFSLANCAAYRLSPSGHWHPLSQTDTANLIKVV